VITELINFGENILGNFVNLSAGNSILRHSVMPDVHTFEYYKYCISLMAECLEQCSQSLNVIFGDDEYRFDNSNPVVKLDIQPEHTLVMKGGRSVPNIVKGDIKTLDGSGKYLVRVQNYGYYNSLDKVIEYSVPNLVNLKTSPLTEGYADKCSYIAPVIYEDTNFVNPRRHQTFTMFSDNPCPRRAKFSADTGVTNISGCFDKDDLLKTYYNSKIMVNIHQTDHHHTFEELRVLPALCNGVLIVSEDVPLKEYIPYSDSIIWAPYEGIQDKLEDVQNNYEEYYSKIFTDGLRNTLHLLRKQNKETFTNILWQKTKTPLN